MKILLTNDDLNEASLVHLMWVLYLQWESSQRSYFINQKIIDSLHKNYRKYICKSKTI